MKFWGVFSASLKPPLSLLISASITMQHYPFYMFGTMKITLYFLRSFPFGLVIAPLDDMGDRYDEKIMQCHVK